ncbi:hypothetical protein MPER_07307 [Moniliophthora perniciosa FA553]|nr:hypothetical protein MPER_07307 [Moniliophthora perniciosa FA553]
MKVMDAAPGARAYFGDVSRIREEKSSLTDQGVNAVEAGKKQKVAEDRNEEASFGQTIRSAYDLSLAIRMATGDYHLRRKLNYNPGVETLGKLVADFKVQSESDPKKAQVLSQLTAIHKEVAKTLHSYRTGLYDSRFKLKVTQPGCEREIYVSEYSDFEDELPKWLENAPISGYGDNRTLETK